MPQEFTLEDFAKPDEFRLDDFSKPDESYALQEPETAGLHVQPASTNRQALAQGIRPPAGIARAGTVAGGPEAEILPGEEPREIVPISAPSPADLELERRLNQQTGRVDFESATPPAESGLFETITSPIPAGPELATVAKAFSTPTAALADIGSGGIGSILAAANPVTLLADLYRRNKTEENVGENLKALWAGEPSPIGQTMENIKAPGISVPYVGTRAITEMAPRLAGVTAMQAVGVPAPVSAAGIFGITETGEFDIPSAAVASALPFVGKYAGEISASLAAKTGVSSPTALQWIQGAGSLAAVNGYLGVIQASEIANLPPEERKQAIIEAIAVDLAQSPLGIGGGPSRAVRVAAENAAKAGAPKIAGAMLDVRFGEVRPGVWGRLGGPVEAGTPIPAKKPIAPPSVAPPVVIATPQKSSDELAAENTARAQAEHEAYIASAEALRQEQRAALQTPIGKPQPTAAELMSAEKAAQPQRGPVEDYVGGEQLPVTIPAAEVRATVEQPNVPRGTEIVPQAPPTATPGGAKPEAGRAVPEPVKPAATTEAAGKPTDVGAALLERHGLKEGMAVEFQLKSGGKTYYGTLSGPAGEGNVSVRISKGPLKGQTRILDPLKNNVAPLASTRGMSARLAELDTLRPEERRAVKAQAREFRDLIEHDPEFWTLTESEVSHPSERIQAIAKSESEQKAIAAFFKKVGMENENPKSPIAQAKALPKFMRYKEGREKPVEDLKLEEAETTAQQNARLAVERKAAQKQATALAATESARLKAQQGIGGDLGTAGQGTLLPEPGQQEFFRQGPGAQTRPATAKSEPLETIEGTGLKHAIDELERVSYGFKERPQQERQEMAAAWLRAGDTLSKNGQAGSDLAGELIANPKRGLTGDESALLLRHKVELENALNDAAEKSFSSDPDIKMMAQASVEGFRNQLESFMDAVALRGSEWGREGRWRQALAHEDFSFETRSRILRAAKGGEPLTNTEVETLKRRIAADKTIMEAYQKEIEAYEAAKRKEGVEHLLTGVQREVIQELHYSKWALKEVEKWAAKVKTNTTNMRQALAQQLSGLGVPQGPGAKTADAAQTRFAPGDIRKNVAGVGAEKMAFGITEPGAWRKSMLDEFGMNIERFLDQGFEDALKLHFEDIAALSAKYAGKQKERVTRAVKQPTLPAERKAQLADKIQEKIKTEKKDEVAPLAQQLAKIAVEEGARGWRAITDSVHAELKQSIPGLDYRTTMDMILGEKEFKPLSTVPEEVALRQGRQEIAAVRNIQKIARHKQEERVAPKKRGPAIQEYSDFRRWIGSKFAELKKKYPVQIADPARQLRSALAAREKYYANRIKDLEHEIETRTKIVRVRGEPPTSPALEAKKAEYRRLKAERAEIFKAELTDEQKLKLAVKAMERSEAEFRRRRESGEFTVEDEPKPWQDTPEFQAAKARRDAEKAAFEELRDLDADFQRQSEIRERETQARALLRSYEQASQQLTDAQARLAAGDISEPGQPQNRPLPPELEVLKQQAEAKRAELKAVNDAIEELRNPKKTFSEIEAEKTAAVQARIDEVVRQINEGDIAAKQQRVSTASPDRAALQSELAALNGIKAQLRRAAVAKTPEERALASFLTRTTNDIARLLERKARLDKLIADGTITKADLERPKRKPLDISQNPKAMALKAKQVAIRNEILQAEFEAKLKLENLPQTIWRGIRNTGSTFVNITSSMDLSAPRQMFLAMLANSSRLVTSPKIGAKMTFIPLGRLFEALASENRSRTLEQWRRNRPNAVSGLDKLAKIQYTDLHTTEFTRWEENAHSLMDQWAQAPISRAQPFRAALTIASKPVRASNRAFITALNTQRAMLFDYLLEVNFKDRAPTKSELEILGNLVNVSTGRGKLGRGAGKVASSVLWAPSLLASRVQVLTGQPLWGGGPWKGSARARRIVVKEYARWIASAAALIAVSRIFDEKDESSPLSSDWTKIKRGERLRLDLLAGFQQPVTVAARIAAGKTKSSETDKVRNISTFGTGEVIWNFFKNKTRPDIAAAVRTAIAIVDAGKEGKDVRVTPGEAAAGLVPIPLSLRDTVAVFRERGLPEALIIQIFSEFGAGVTMYEEHENQK